jgi:hypothetical protein
MAAVVFSTPEEVGRSAVSLKTGPDFGYGGR